MRGHFLASVEPGFGFYISPLLDGSLGMRHLMTSRLHSPLKFILSNEDGTIYFMDHNEDYIHTWTGLIDKKKMSPTPVPWEVLVAEVMEVGINVMIQTHLQVRMNFLLMVLVSRRRLLLIWFLHNLGGVFPFSFWASWFHTYHPTPCSILVSQEEFHFIVFFWVSFFLFKPVLCLQTRWPSAGWSMQWGTGAMLL